jgi:fructokinase
MDTTGVQIDSAHPTGEVRVTIERNEPRYEILGGRAYDFIGTGAALGAIRGTKPAMVVHGTLAVRNDASARTLRSLLEETGVAAFMDVNLRPPWYDRSCVKEWLAGAHWAKLNTQELREITRGHGDDEALTRGLLEEQGLSEVVLTRGAEGAVSITAGEKPVARAAEPPDPFVDAVGAGDAFSAVTLTGFLRGWPTGVRMERAVRFASALCGLRGAVTTDRGWYNIFLAEWES